MENYFKLNTVGFVRLKKGTFQIDLISDYVPALMNLDGFTHLQVLWWGHYCDTEAQRQTLVAHVTGLSPKTYMQQRRLSEALKELRKKERKIIEIVFDYQFKSHEAFSRAFKKQFGINPKQIRGGFSPSNLSMTSPIDDDYLYQSESEIYIPVE